MRFVLPILFFLFSTNVHAELVERIVAIVNEEIVTLSDLNKFEQKLKQDGLTDDILIPDEQTKQEVLKNRDKLLQKLIEEKLIDSEVRRQNLSVTFERVEQEIRTIARRNSMTRDKLKEVIQARGTSFSDYQEFIKTGLERSSLIDKSVTSKIKISEDDVLAQYTNQVKDSDDQIFEYTIAHILFLNEKGGAAAARGRADFVIQKIKEGGDFEKLAGEFSEDPNYSPGGMLGTFKSGEFLKEMEAAVSKLSVNDTSAPVSTKAGVHVLRLIKKRAVPDPKAEKEKEQIRGQLGERAYKRQFASFMEQLRNDAFIRINQK